MRFAVTTADAARLVYDDENGRMDAATFAAIGRTHGRWWTVAGPDVGFDVDLNDHRCVAFVFAALADPDLPIDATVTRLAAEWIGSLDLGWSPDDYDPDVVY